MAKTFSSISKGLSLLSFFPSGKYKSCRVDSIVEQDPAYIDYVRINYGMLFDKEVLDKTMQSHEYRYEQRTKDIEKGQWKIKKYGIAALFNNPEHDEEYEREMGLVLLEDVPF